MFKKNILKCTDVYGLELNKGDKVIPIVKNIISDKLGIITDIKYDKKLSYITIVDEKGDIIHENILSSYYTTEQRYHEKEYENIILWINFHSDKGYSENKIPLNNNTEINFFIPNNIIGMSISYDKYEVDEDGDLNSYSKELYFFALKKKVTVYIDEELDEQIIEIKSNGKRDWINKEANVVLCKTYKELKEQLSKTIDEIKKNNLDKCNRKIPYEKNTELQNIEKKLTNKQ